MTIPIAALLAFAAWTLLSLVLTVGSYRWARILTGRASPEAFAEYEITGAGWYRRALRAHANCVENLPVFAAIVLSATSMGLDSAWLDTLALAVIVARVPHTLVHVLFEQTSKVVMIRFSFFAVQLVSMVAMIAAIGSTVW